MIHVICGIMLTMGVFTRMVSLVLLLQMIYFISDIEWGEFAQFYPIAILLLMLFSNILTNELEPIERISERLRSQKKKWMRRGLLLSAPLFFAILLIFPMQYIISFFDRSML